MKEKIVVTKSRRKLYAHRGGKPFTLMCNDGAKLTSMGSQDTPILYLMDEVLDRAIYGSHEEWAVDPECNKYTFHVLSKPVLLLGLVDHPGHRVRQKYFKGY